MTRTIPFVDIQRLHGPLRAELLDAFERVLDSGAYVQGREVRTLETEFAAAMGVRHAVAVSNGTAALHLALLACGIGPGDEVITVANTFFATAEAIVAVGAKPVFVDISADGHLINCDAIERAITPRTRAILPVHLYGELADMERILAIARSHDLRVIEDACQAHGAQRANTAAGTFGDAGCFSFYPTKNLGTVGEGGMIVTNSDEVAQSAAMLRDHGQTNKHEHLASAFNFRTSELQAAALRVCLPHLEGWNHSRRVASEKYFDALGASGIGLPAKVEDGSHVYHLFVVRSARRAALSSFLAERGIATAIHYPKPIHLQPAFSEQGGAPVALPNTEAAANEILSLPFHPGIADWEIEAVADAIAAFSSAQSRSGRISA